MVGGGSKFALSCPGAAGRGADVGPLVLLHYQDYCEVIIDHYNSIYTLSLSTRLDILHGENTVQIIYLLVQ